ncbi:MAG: hypothetical protein F4Z31_05965 [Gemmatimonadetes bacterium]|nr:hypothetical protein [Gemmatimonadota bacterium]
MTENIERRFHEFRADGDTVSGPLMVYGDEARFGDWRERFQPGSLTVGEDVIANLQHDRARPVARTGAGLSLRDEGNALHAAIVFPNTAYAREARELVTAKILRGFSIEFRSIREEWQQRTRIVHEARLLGLALVDRPAYPASQIALRFEEMHVPPRTRRYWV